MRKIWNGLEAIELRCGDARATVTLHGAHVVEYFPYAAAPDLLFISGRSEFADGKPIRGGVPVCFPWFGAPPEGKSGSHGFVRNSAWQLSEADDGRAVFTFSAPEFRLRYTVTLTDTLDLTLDIENISDVPFTYSGALHTYFRVADVRSVGISGVENAGYSDSLTREDKVQDVPLVIDREVDRAYRSEAAVTLTDPGLQRRIVISKRGSRSTVIWNPWIDKSRRMPDFGDDEYSYMLCVEAANVPAIADQRTIAPHAAAELAQSIRVEPLA